MSCVQASEKPKSPVVDIKVSAYLVVVVICVILFLDSKHQFSDICGHLHCRFKTNIFLFFYFLQKDAEEAAKVESTLAEDHSKSTKKCKPRPLIIIISVLFDLNTHDIHFSCVAKTKVEDEENVPPQATVKKVRNFDSYGHAFMGNKTLVS